MGDEPKFIEKWDFRRQENNFDDSSSDDDPVLDSNQMDNGTETVTREQQPAKTRKRRCKKDESKPEKAKQVRKRKPNNVCEEEENKKKEEKDEVGMFMKTLLDDLSASRKSLMDWMKTELYGSDQKVASRPVVAQRSMKKRRVMKKKKVEEEEEEKTEMTKSKEIAQNNGDQVQELDCNGGLLKTGQGGLDINYIQQQQQQQEEVREAIVTHNEKEKEKNVTVTNPKSVVLAIKAPNLSQQQKKMREANNIKKRSSSSMVETTGTKTQKDHNFMIPIAPKQPSQSPQPSSLMQSIPVSSSLSSLLFPSSNQGIASFASNNNFQMRQQPEEVSQIPDYSEFQTGFNNNNGYFSAFPAAFQPNLMAGGYNFPAQLNPLTSLQQQRDNNNMFGGLRMANGAIRFSGNRFPEAEAGDGLHDYRTSSGR